MNWRALALGPLLAVGSAALPTAVVQAQSGSCDQPVQSFVQLAALFEELRGDEDETLLSAELLELPDAPCRAYWMLEILPRRGDVVEVVLNAFTLAVEPIDPDQLWEQAADAETAEDEVYVTEIIMVGGEGSDYLEGDWSDDVSTGGEGSDIFFVTPGADLITDFEPDHDIIDFTDFASDYEGFSSFGSVSEVLAAAEQTRVSGRKALVIHLGGEDGDWRLTLYGVERADLSEDNMSFDIDGFFDDAFEPEDYPEKEIFASDDTEVFVPAYAWDGGVAEPELVEGSRTTAVAVLDLLGLDYRADTLEDE